MLTLNCMEGGDPSRVIRVKTSKYGVVNMKKDENDCVRDASHRLVQNIQATCDGLSICAVQKFASYTKVGQTNSVLKIGIHVCRSYMPTNIYGTYCT